MEASFPGSTQVRRKFTLDVVELVPGAGSVSVGPISVRGWHVVHPSGVPALALRVEADNRAFGYSGDTSWTPALLEAAAGTDVFACEANTHGRPVPFHLDYEDVLAHADELDTGRLILTQMGQSGAAELPRATSRPRRACPSRLRCLLQAHLVMRHARSIGAACP